MARLVSSDAFDQTTFSISYFVPDAVELQFNNDAIYPFDDRLYEDMLYVYSRIDMLETSIEVYGQGITLDDAGHIAGGTAQAYAKWFFDQDSGQWLWSFALTDVALGMVELQAALDSTRSADDRSVLNRALAGNDTFLLSAQADRAFGLGGNDLMRGFGGADWLMGGAGHDLLIGGAGNDTLDGGLGRDTLDGGAGVDVLTGGAGADLLLGGGGADVFAFRSGQGRDVIDDFQDGIDRIRLIDRGDAAILPVIAADGGDTVIEWGTTVIRLTGVDAALIDAADFI